jgi:hypothetical protein
MIKKISFSILLEQCLQRLDQGESLPDLLAEYPAQADQIQPLLLVAMASRTFPIPVPSQTAQRLGRNQMLAEMNRLETKQAFRKKAAIPTVSRIFGALASAVRAGGFTHLAYSYRLASVTLVLILSAGFYTLNASAASQPGDFLFPLKLRIEQAGLTMPYTDQEPPLGPPQPWKFGQVFWALEGAPDFFFDQDGEKDDEKDFREAEKEIAQELKEAEKEAAEAEREETKDLKEAEKEADQELKEEEKEAAEDLKEEEKEAAEDLKEEEQEAAEADKEEEQEAAEADKEEEQDTKDTDKEIRKAEKEAEKIEKESLKDDKKTK